MTITASMTDAPAGVQRIFAAADPSWQAHVDRYGPLPGRVDLVALLQEAGLTGRGGAGFPTATKLRGVAARRGAVVVANGAEGEPASAKDRTLMQRAPHLVLDGLELTARAVGARTAYVATSFPEIAAALEEQVARRRRQGSRRDVRIEVVQVADRFVAGEESALVNALNGRPGIPSDRLVRVYERGVRRQPTLVQNVETLAQIALLARYGATWYRSIGTPDQPGTFLATVSGDVAAQGVYEVGHGTPLGELLGSAGPPAGGAQAVLVGGFHGAWVPGAHVDSVPLSRAGLAPYRAAVGAGVVVVLGPRRCGVDESAGIAAYLADQVAGQCGPCVNGLPRMADALTRLSRRERDPRLPDEVARLAGLVRGRGACSHPDGTARFVTSALNVFADEVAVHLGGGCSVAAAR